MQTETLRIKIRTCKWNVGHSQLFLQLSACTCCLDEQILGSMRVKVSLLRSSWDPCEDASCQSVLESEPSVEAHPSLSSWQPLKWTKETARLSGGVRGILHRLNWPVRGRFNPKCVVCFWCYIPISAVTRVKSKCSTWHVSSVWHHRIENSKNMRSVQRQNWENFTGKTSSVIRVGRLLWKCNRLQVI